MSTEPTEPASWWESDPTAFAALVAGLGVLNEPPSGEPAPAADRLLRALRDFARSRGTNSSIAAFIGGAAGPALGASFFDGTAFRRLVQTPQTILDEADLRETQRRMGRLDLTRAELATARAAHAGLIAATIAYDARRTAQTARDARAAVGALLGVIGANLTREDGAPFGSTAEKARRDATARAVAAPVLEELVARVLDVPEQRLAVYGTLRRGEPNHSHIADLGEPRAGVVHGSVAEKDGYPVFRWDEAGADIPVELYASSALTPGRWKPLDRFEGDAYRRQYVPVHERDGARRIRVAMIYAAAGDNERLGGRPGD